MYDRNVEGRILQFEASGGLMHSSLVMQDKQTDSFWALMKGRSIAGRLKGSPLRELPVHQKMRWGDWKKLHPDTRVLSVGGIEHIRDNPYESYFSSKDGFRGEGATDKRLATKTPVYAFRLDGQAYAVPFSAVRGGALFQIGRHILFLYRPAKARLLRSTAAFALSDGTSYRKTPQGWQEEATGALFDPEAAHFRGSPAGRSLSGFDTFWYNWSLNNPQTRLLAE